MPATTLIDRALIRLSGDGVRDFLQGLVTSDVAKDLPVWTGLLTPQGKCLFDFLVWADGDDLLLDCKAEQADALAKRLTLYRLRRPIAIAREPDMAVHWSPDGDQGVPDPRLPALGRRWLGPADETATGWTEHRLHHGVCEGAAELETGQAPPDRLAQARRSDHRGDDRHRHGVHDRLVEAGADAGARDRQLHTAQRLPATRPQRPHALPRLGRDRLQPHHGHSGDGGKCPDDGDDQGRDIAGAEDEHDGHEVVLRDLEPGDIDALVAYWVDADPAYLDFLGVDRVKLGTADDIRARFASMVRSGDPDQDRLVLVSTVDGVVTSYTNFHFVSPDENYMHAHIIRPAARGKGLASSSFANLARAWSRAEPDERSAPASWSRAESIEDAGRLLARSSWSR